MDDFVETMDIYSRPGTEVVFLGQNGWDADLREALHVLTVGATYTVKKIDVRSSTSYVTFEETPGYYNTVMFPPK